MEKVLIKNAMLHIEGGKWNSTFATVAILAQGTDWAVAVMQAFCYTSSILAGCGGIFENYIINCAAN